MLIFLPVLPTKYYRAYQPGLCSRAGVIAQPTVAHATPGARRAGGVRDGHRRDHQLRRQGRGALPALSDHPLQPHRAGDAAAAGAGGGGLGEQSQPQAARGERV